MEEDRAEVHEGGTLGDEGVGAGDGGAGDKVDGLEDVAHLEAVDEEGEVEGVGGRGSRGRVARLKEGELGTRDHIAL